MYGGASFGKAFCVCSAGREGKRVVSLQIQASVCVFAFHCVGVGLPVLARDCILQSAKVSILYLSGVRQSRVLKVAGDVELSFCVQQMCFIYLFFIV